MKEEGRAAETSEPESNDDVLSWVRERRHGRIAFKLPTLPTGPLAKSKGDQTKSRGDQTKSKGDQAKSRPCNAKRRSDQTNSKPDQAKSRPDQARSRPDQTESRPDCFGRDDLGEISNPCLSQGLWRLRHLDFQRKKS